MKKLVSLAFGLMLFSCINPSKNNIESDSLLSFNKDFIIGNWIVIDLHPISDNQKEKYLAQQYISNLKKSIVLTPTQFLKNGINKTVNFESNKIDISKWT